MIPQVPASSLKLSRRSACDRCKAYKLKCLREGTVTDPCQRCAKANMSCTTTVEQAVDTASSQYKRNHEQRKGLTRRIHSEEQRDRQGSENNGEVNGRPTSGLSSGRQDQNKQRVTNNLRLLPRQTTSEQPHGVLLNSMGSNLSHQFSMALETSSFPLADPILSQDDLDMLIADYVPYQLRPNQDSVMKLGFDDDQMLGPPTNSTFTESIDHSSLSVDFNRTQQVALIPDAPLPTVETALAGPYDHHKALVDLQLEFLRDQEKLNRAAKLPYPPGHNPLKCSTAVQHHPINRLLNQTARFWEVLKAMCIGDVSDSAESERQDSSIPSHQTITSADHILLVTMVATYTMLVRSCREVFGRLYAGFELAVTDPSVSLADASLPRLQFGELEIENNLYVQVNILIELMSSMLQRIASALQITSPASISKTALPASRYCLPFWTNQTALVLRDAILGEERSQTGDFCQGELMINVKDILKDQRMK